MILEYHISVSSTNIILQYIIINFEESCSIILCIRPYDVDSFTFDQTISNYRVSICFYIYEPTQSLTLISTVPAMIPSTVDSAKGSNVLSFRRMKSGFRMYPLRPLYSKIPRFSIMAKSENRWLSCIYSSSQFNNIQYNVRNRNLSTRTIFRHSAAGISNERSP